MTQLNKKWEVGYSSSAGKQKKDLPGKIQDLLDTLAKEIEFSGPIRKNWPNFGPLYKTKRVPKDSYHCHLKKGKPTYVACWCIEDKKVKIIEIFYVGTHEKAPY